MNAEGYRLWGPFRSLKIVLLLLGLAAASALLAIIFVDGRLARANDDLEALTEIDCDPNQVYSDPGDADAAAALAEAGYTCTGLFNKGQLPGTFQQVGELWHLTEDSVHHIRIIFFGGANSGFGDAKLCLDDDPDPINNIAPGGAPPASCIGKEFAQSFQQGVDGGPSYPPAKAADVDPEERAGLFEIAIEGLIEISEDFGGTAVGGWNINIDDYTEALLHFNKGEFSIVGFYQPAPKTNIRVTKSDDPDPVALGGQLTYTLLVENTSTVAAENVTAHDDLSPAVTFVSATPSQGTCLHDGVNPNGDVDCNLGTLPPGGSATITIVVDVGTDPAFCDTTITNFVEVATTTEETDEADNRDEEDTLIQCAAIQIEKRSTKSENPLVSNAGAVFSYDGASVTDNGPGDEDPAIGVVCVSSLQPGSYTVNEVTPPPGYGDASEVDVVVAAVIGTNCSDNLPGAGGLATFTNAPLYDLQVNFRDGGSGETSVTSITCVDIEPADSTDPADGWDASSTYLDEEAPDTIVCTIVVDP